MKQSLVTALALTALTTACTAPPDSVEQTQQPLVASPKKVAYYPVWTSGGNDLEASFPQAPASIPWTKLTHINVAFVGINSSWQCAWVNDDGSAAPSFQTAAQNLISYRNANHPGVKILLAVGGWTMSWRFSQAFSNSTNRTAFVNSCVNLVNSMGADGIDIDWEYPTNLGDKTHCPSGCQSSADPANLTAGLDLFRAHAGFSGKLLTAALGVEDPSAPPPRYYEYAKFFDTTPPRFDWVNLMTYDFYGSWTNPNVTAPYSAATVAMNNLVTLGIGSGNKHRALMGIPFYGPAWYNVASPGTPGTPGTFLGNVSFKKAKAILGANPTKCQLKTSGNDHYIWCNGGSVTLNGVARSNLWISYEDTDVVGAKADWVATNDWGGMMWWSQGEDTDAADLVGIIDAKLSSGPPPPPPPPSSWTSTDIGAVAAAGTFSESGNTLTLEGSGADIYGTADEFRYAYRSITGDVTITARVASLENTNGWAKAGVMMRDGTSAGARNLFMLVSPTATNKYRYQTRTGAGLSTTSTASAGSSAVPVWVKLERVGDTFKGSYATASTGPWTQVGTTTSVDLPDTILVGVAVTSHIDGTLATGVFDTVTVTVPGPTPPQPPTGLVATPGNAVVNLTWNASATATSYTVKRGIASHAYDMSFPVPAGTSYQDSSVSNGTKYYYAVIASNAAGDSLESSEASATPVAPMPPAPPANLTATPGNTQVSLSWSASATATSYTIRRRLMLNGTVDGTYAGITTTSFTDPGLTNGTTYYYSVSATNTVGEGAESGQIPATPVAPPAWSQADIGAVGMAGSYTDASGTLTVKGAGADIWNTADAFHYVYKDVSGDATITARVVSLQNTNVWAKAGVMMRDGTAAGARNAFMLVSPTATNKFRLQSRVSTGGTTTSTPSTPNSFLPAWLRVKRVGNSFTVYYSSTGASGSWTQVGGAVTITMPATYKIGLAVTSHTTSALTTAVFDNVTVTQP